MIWTPEAWHKSNLQLQDEARSMLLSAYAGAAAASTKHSDPPCPDSRFREM
jgi:hypothetical protein